MPRQARLDAPDTLHHVMVRGLDRRAIFRDDADRGDFVAAVLREAPVPTTRVPAPVALETLATRLAAGLGVPLPALLGKTQTQAAVAARQLLAYVWVERLGQPASALARALGQTRGNVSLAARKRAAHAARWQAEMSRLCRG